MFDGGRLAPSYARGVPRPFTPEERAVLAELAKTGPAELAAQLDVAEYGEPWFSGSQSFNIVVPDSAPAVDLPDGIITTTDRLVRQGGEPTGGVMLWLKDGRVASYEYYWHTDAMPARQPIPEEIVDWENLFS